MLSKPKPDMLKIQDLNSEFLLDALTDPAIIKKLDINVLKVPSTHLK